MGRHTPLQQPADGVVAYAKRLRKDQAAKPNGKASDGRPPHPMNAQVLKQIFRRINGSRQQRG